MDYKLRIRIISTFLGLSLVIGTPSKASEDEAQAPKAESSPQVEQALSNSKGKRPPKLLARKLPEYPSIEAIRSNEGIVEVELMVGKDGKVYEPVVLRSTSQRFEKETLSAIRGYTYSPAMHNGAVVTGRTTVRVTFVMKQKVDKVSPEFAIKYRRVKKMLDKGKADQKTVEKNIKGMAKTEPLNVYSLAQLNLMKLRASMVFADKDEQIEATHSLLLFDERVGEKGKILDADIKRKVIQSLFRLQLETQRYGDALETYRDFAGKDPELKKRFSPIVKKIFTVINDETQAVGI